MRFIKMHGIGNDYVYINGLTEPLPGDEAALADLARQLSDRHRGVGGDGMILVLPPAAGVEADVRMRMFNADGSESEMCGNGVRCVCKLTHDHGLSRSNPMRIQTGRGVLSLRYSTDAQGKVDQVTVDMGQPLLLPGDIPVNIPDLRQVVNHPIKGLIDWPKPTDWVRASGLDARMTCASMGNPHVVFFCEDAAMVPLPTVGPIVERHPVFPRRVNVHFVQVHHRGELTMRTWERGSGITLACGTGDPAVCVAGVLTDRTERSVLAHLPGGDLRLEWRQHDQHVLMTGPATEVFTGQWPD